MRKIDETIVELDQKSEKLNPVWEHVKKYFPIFSTTLLTLLVLFFILRVFHNKPYFTAAIIQDNIRSIVGSLRKIDDDCNILSIENEKNYVDFLTVEKFTSSEVGPLNLAYPKNWQGPYLKNNPTLQEKLYEIVKTKDGIFVIPGNGVKLPNGLTVGKDFKIMYQSDISKMLKMGGKLNYNGKPLATKLEFKIGDWGNQKEKQKRTREISSIDEEFNEAMPFTQNETAQSKC